MSMNGQTSISNTRSCNPLGWIIRLVAYLALFIATSGGYSGQLTLTWNDNSDNEDGFTIERSVDEGVFEVIGEVGANETSYLDVGIVDNRNYVYRVSAFNENGSSGYSNTAAGMLEIEDAPTITPIDDVSILEGGESGAIPFSIADIDSSVASLVVTTGSSNPSLMPTSGIEIVGSGSNRTISLTPVGGASGSATISVTVSDGEYTTYEYFELEVRTIAAPSINGVDDIAVSQGTAIAPIEISISDPDTDVESLSISFTSSNEELLPEGNVDLSGSGAQRILTLEPVEGRTGETELTITVSDGDAEAIETFKIVVFSLPVIASQPSSLSHIAGDTTAFNVVASGYPSPSYQWLFNGVPIDGANESELLFERLKRSDEGSYSVLVANEYGSVQSDVAQLTVESLITVTQFPVDVVVEGDGTAVLSVSAQGPGLTYQWYRGESGDRSNPIEGATSSTYETDTITGDSKFWVEISTGGIAQGIETLEVETINVFYVVPPKYYFGNVGPGQSGQFGLYVRGNNTAVLLLEIVTLGITFEIVDIVISENGSFEYRDNSGALFLSGELSESSVSGGFAGSDITFTGDRSGVNGPSADFDGFYFAAIPNTSDGRVLMIVAPDGQGFVSISIGGVGKAGFASIDGSGVVTADLDSEYIMAVSLDEQYASLNGTLIAGDENYAVDGQREDAESNNRLYNTSIRGQVGRGSSTMIAGFVVNGTGNQKVLIRGLGPAMRSLGVEDAISDPQILLYRLGEETPMVENDDWGSAANAAAIASSAQIAGAAPLPSNSKDAALLLELGPGVYTAVVKNGEGVEGTALVEIFDVSAAEGEDTGSSLANISMRGEVGNSNDVTIAGFAVTGDTPKRMMIRVMGSELDAYGVSNTLSDPELVLYDMGGEEAVLIATNDDWQEDADVAREAAASSGAFPFDENSQSAAKVIWLDPGLYTAVAKSGSAAKGVVLVEVYEVE